MTPHSIDLIIENVSLPIQQVYEMNGTYLFVFDCRLILMSDKTYEKVTPHPRVEVDDHNHIYMLGPVATIVVLLSSKDL